MVGVGARKISRGHPKRLWYCGPFMHNSHFLFYCMAPRYICTENNMPRAYHLVHSKTTARCLSFSLSLSPILTPLSLTPRISQDCSCTFGIFYCIAYGRTLAGRLCVRGWFMLKITSPSLSLSLSIIFCSSKLIQRVGRNALKV